MRLFCRRIIAAMQGGVGKYPGSDILQEDATFLLQEDGSSSIQQEG